MPVQLAPDELLSAARAGEVLGTSRFKVARMTTEGRLPAAQVTPLGRLYRRADLEKYAAEREAVAEQKNSRA